MHDQANPSQEQEAAWGFPVSDESRWPASVAVVVAIVLYVTLPDELVFGPIWKWAFPVVEMALLIALTAGWPHRGVTETNQQRMAAIVSILIVNVANVASLVALVDLLLHGHKTTAQELVFAAIQIWLTNVIVFGLWYWELDRGGPGARLRPPEQRRQPDFLFPQMVNPESAPSGWGPKFVDYLFVSFTNATAFSPTDTMPLTPWAKLLMMIQAMVSLLTVALVAARAVNILR